jgi:hypothetical protein
MAPISSSVKLETKTTKVMRRHRIQTLMFESGMTFML